VQVFVEELIKNVSPEKLYFIAHSMGGRIISRSIAALSAKGVGIETKTKEVVLAAPDIDAEIFNRDIAPKFYKSGHNATLYVSSSDRALALSGWIFRGKRAGYLDGKNSTAPGVEMIDATDVDFKFLGHSYYAENRRVISDMFYLIQHGLRAADRHSLVQVEGKNGQYWKFKK
jgi:esterase/lipase superfamily enzyme